MKKKQLTNRFLLLFLSVKLLNTRFCFNFYCIFCFYISRKVRYYCLLNQFSFHLFHSSLHILQSFLFFICYLKYAESYFWKQTIFNLIISQISLKNFYCEEENNRTSIQNIARKISTSYSRKRACICLREMAKTKFSMGIDIYVNLAQIQHKA